MEVFRSFRFHAARYLPNLGRIEPVGVAGPAHIVYYVKEFGKDLALLRCRPSPYIEYLVNI